MATDDKQTSTWIHLMLAILLEFINPLVWTMLLWGWMVFTTWELTVHDRLHRGKPKKKESLHSRRQRKRADRNGPRYWKSRRPRKRQYKPKPKSHPPKSNKKQGRSAPPRRKPRKSYCGPFTGPYWVGHWTRRLLKTWDDATAECMPRLPFGQFWGALGSTASFDLFAIHPRAFLSGMEPNDTFPIIWDSGASHTITPNENDFITPPRPVPGGINLTGIGSGLDIKGVGEVEWVVIDREGRPKTILITAYHVPGSKVRLLSPQQVIQAYKLRLHGSQPPTVTLGTEELIFQDPNDNSYVRVPFHPRNNLPMSAAFNKATLSSRTVELNLCVTDETNQNLSESQKELLRWHFRLGHLNFAAVQQLLRSSALGSSSLQTAASKCEIPRCASCQFGKAKRRPTGITHSRSNPERDGALKAGDLLPGQCVSVDHFVCSNKGRLLESRGKTSEDHMHSGGCIFIDHATGYVHVEHQVKLTTHETLFAKQRFENHSHDYGVIIQQYQADNGIFDSRGFEAELQEYKQIIKFAGVGAHHQNGVAERGIQTIMSMARTMMLHAAIRWPDVADPSLWPLAVDQAVYIYNHVPNAKSGQSPEDLYSRTTWPRHQLQDIHVWGAPAYVLDSAMQDGKKLPRWTPRSRRAVHLGTSKKHASNVPLVLNLDTLAISPQYHVVFDDWFSTVEAGPDLAPPEWEDLFTGSRYQYPFEPHEAPELDDSWMDSEERAHRRNVARQQEIRSAQRPGNPDSRPPPTEIESPSIQESPPQPVAMPPRRETAAVQPPLPREHPPSATAIPPPAHPPTPQRKPPPAQREPPPAQREAPPPDLRRSVRLQEKRATYASNALEMNHTTIRDDDSYPTAFAARKVNSDPDTLRLDEAMRDPEADEFRECMRVEISSLEGEKTWDVIPRDEATSKVLPGTWTFKRKRFPDGRVKKLKARYCVRGDLQPEADIGETYAPVIGWSTVRLMLIFSLAFGLATRSIDFSNAFAQAELETPIFIEIPQGFEGGTTGSRNGDRRNSHVLKLNKSLYGICEAPHFWYEKLKSGLEDQGFHVSPLDPCLFIHPKMIAVSFVDDVFFIGWDGTAIDAMIKTIKDAGYTLTEDGEISSFLGIQIDRSEDGKTFTLLQTGLIDSILTATGMTDCNPAWTPALTVALGSDVDGAPMSDDWDYPQVIGKLLYLCGTRPDIQFAVSQVARFTHSPKQSHAQAVKLICRYLKATRTKGLILNPVTDELTVDCFCDSDFAGLWRQEDDQDPVCVKSRTGYVIKVAGCPLTWSSKLQSEVALSTMSAEYVALSQAMRELIPLRRMVSEVCKALKIKPYTGTKIKSTVFEDNNGALGMAVSPKITPRNKHIAIKYHFFLENVKSGDIQVIKIDSAEQQSDILTKGLGRTIFETVRKLLKGW